MRLCAGSLHHTLINVSLMIWKLILAMSASEVVMQALKWKSFKCMWHWFSKNLLLHIFCSVWVWGIGYQFFLFKACWWLESFNECCFPHSSASEEQNPGKSVTKELWKLSILTCGREWSLVLEVFRTHSPVSVVDLDIFWMKTLLHDKGNIQKLR